MLDEAALRARLAAALAEPGHDNVRATRIMHEAGHGTPIWEAARKAFNDGSPEAIEHFLYVTVPALIASDDRVELSQFVEDPIIGAELRAEALGVLEEGDDTAIAAFVQDLPSRLRTDLRLQAVRSMALGPEVRKAANAALNADTVEALRTFLTTGLREAVARDKAAADQATGNGEEGGQADGQPSGGGSGVTQAGLTTATPGTAGTTAAESGTTTAQLASTGTDAPVGSLVVGGAVAIALGAGTLVAARRRSRES